jgi:uncharacterized protein (TIGR02145 family)
MLQKNITKHAYRQLLLLLLFVISFIPIAEELNAQNLQRMSIEREDAGTGIPVFTEHPDKAGIVIESSVPGLRFSSNMQGIVEVKEPASGRYVLIIEPFTQIIRVDAENFVQERFRVGNPQARDVLYFSVRPEERQSDLISVIFNVEPDDALLFLNGQQVETNTTVQLPTRGYELRLEREGYRSISEVVNVTQDNILFSYTMEEIDIVPVRIRSNAIGAAVIIDGTERGQIDSGGGLGLFLFPGTYALSLNASGYEPKNQTLEVSEDGNNEIRVEIERNTGELIMDIEPSDANILLNRQDYSEQRSIELAPGRYRLEVEKQDYESYSETIEIARSEVIRRNILLKAHIGSLQFSVSPSNARTELVDSTGEVVESWHGIQLLRNLKAGSYTLRVEADGHLPEEQQIRIVKDEKLEVGIELREGEELERNISTEIVDVTNPVTGQTWMDRNMGASRAALSIDDESAYGDLYQWGRAADGHQRRDSRTTSRVSDNNQPSHGYFIIQNSNWHTQGRSRLWEGVNGTNNPCPEGYRLPSESEWQAERRSWSSNDAEGAFNSVLKLPLGGFRNRRSGTILRIGSYGYYWSASVSGTDAMRFYFDRNNASMRSFDQAFGLSVRCIKD